ncbi:OadG family transporter subunit [Pelagicoccus albus]|uniref:OadG family protein n=1 Tax=Pelagicoccus albus TaxID=415222 RepID=A0A7X1E7E6_9BACT|nr:OadG family transporter subunit [Pelagicoccus albus]MBC2605660.1 OadG family protein [Pelagicoccus albus]
MTYTLAAALAAKPTFAENVSFIIVGFLFVLFVLGVLSLITTCIGALCTRLIKDEPKAKPAAKPAPAAAPAPAPASSIQKDDDIPEHIVALIATATHIALQGRPQKIVSIRSMGQGWAQEGRREIFSSHRFR